MSYLKDERGWQMSNGQLRRTMGYPKDWPQEGVPLTNVDGTFVFVKPQNPHGIRKHRAFAICPDCDAHIPAGRLYQHCKIHKKGA